MEFDCNSTKLKSNFGSDQCRSKCGFEDLIAEFLRKKDKNFEIGGDFFLSPVFLW